MQERHEIGVGGDAECRKPIFLHLVQREDLHRGGSYQHAEWNDRRYAPDAGDMPEGSRTHLRWMKPAWVMVWSAVASDWSKSSLVFIEDDVKVNTQVYIKMLTEKASHRITEIFGNCYVITKTVSRRIWPDSGEKIISAGFSDRNMRPPSSPDNNPIELCSG